MDIIKNDENTNIGTNIRRIRKEKGIGQTELIQKIDLEEWDFEVNLTREALVKNRAGHPAYQGVPAKGHQGHTGDDL